MFAQRKPRLGRRSHFRAVLITATLLGVFMLLSCSSGDHTNAGSGPNLLRAVILQPTGDIQVTEGDTVNFTGTHTGGQSGTTKGYTWRWTEKNVGPRQATSATLTVTFAGDSSGEWVFTFTVKDTDGITDSVSIKVTVRDPK